MGQFSYEKLIVYSCKQQFNVLMGTLVVYLCKQRINVLMRTVVVYSCNQMRSLVVYSCKHWVNVLMRTTYTCKQQFNVFGSSHVAYTSLHGFVDKIMSFFTHPCFECISCSFPIKCPETSRVIKLGFIDSPLFSKISTHPNQQQKIILLEVSIHQNKKKLTFNNKINPILQKIKTKRAPIL